MKTFLFRMGDGNEGNYPRCVVEMDDTECPFAALRALVANAYTPGPLRAYIEANTEVDGGAEYGISASVHEGPDGENAFGAAWITAELQPGSDSPYRVPVVALRDDLDSGALSMLVQS